MEHLVPKNALKRGYVEEEEVVGMFEAPISFPGKNSNHFLSSKELTSHPIPTIYGP